MQELDNIAEEMNKIEIDLVNKRLNAETLNRQKDITTRLLEAEKSDRQRDQDEDKDTDVEVLRLDEYLVLCPEARERE